MKKRIVSIMLTICMLIGAASMLAIPTSAASEDYWTDYASASLSGSGTEGNPFLIGSAEDLAGIKNVDPTGGNYYKLMADIDLSAHIWKPITEFSGTFDGNGKIINGLTIDSTVDGQDDDHDGIGLFCMVKMSSTIKNFIMTNVDINCPDVDYTAAVAGEVYHDDSGTITIENVYVQGSVVGANHVGGIIGGEASSTASTVAVKNCVFEGSIKAILASGSAYSAGIIGNMGGKNTSAVSDCLVIASLTTASSTKTYVAGIVSGNGIAEANPTIKNNIFIAADFNEALRIGGVSKNNTWTNNYTTTNPGGGTANNYGGASTPENEFIGVSAAKLSALNAERSPAVWTARANDVMVPITHEETKNRLPHSGKYRAPEAAPNIDTAWYTADPSADEFTISTLNQLRGLAAITSDKAGAVEKHSFAGCTINLISDIDMSVMTDKWIMIGDYTVGGFAGTFDGNGHTIRGLTAEVNSGDFGLFGALVEEAIIQNLKIEGFEISGATTGDVGALVSSTKFSTVQEDACLSIDNVYVNATINTPNTGSAAGFVAAIGKNGKLQGDRTAYMSISNSVFTGSVTGKTNVAGFIGNGNNVNIAIADCLNAGTITASTNKSSFAAGIVARQDNYVHADNGTGETTIERCINIGKISGANITREIVGAGTDPKANYLASTLTNCYGVLPTVLLSRNANVDENGNPSGATEYDVEIESLVGTTAIFPNGLDSTWTTVNGSVIVPSGVELLATELLYKPQLQYGASVRLAADSGLRFHGTINKEWAAAMGHTGGSVGVLIAPVRYILEAGEFTPEALGAGKYQHVFVTKFQNNSLSTGNYWDFTVALTNIKLGNRYEKFAARSFVIIGDKFYYSDYYEDDNARSIDRVATAALNDTKATKDAVYRYAVVDGETTVYSRYNPTAREILDNLKAVSIDVRALVYNINATEDVGSTRSTNVYNRIMTNTPDVFGLNEWGTKWNNNTSLKSDLKAAGYSVYMGEPSGSPWVSASELDGLQNPIFYKTSKYTLKASGTKWLTKDGTVGRVTNSNQHRIMTYVILEDNTTHITFMFVCVHMDDYGLKLDPKNSDVRLAQATYLLQHINAIKASNSEYNNLPVILGGDLNENAEKTIWGKGAIDPAYYTWGYRATKPVGKATHLNSPYSCSGGAFTCDDEGEDLHTPYTIILDRMFVSKIARITVNSYAVDEKQVSADGESGGWASDHMPVIMQVTIYS